jgi:hypothetical protein
VRLYNKAVRSSGVPGQHYASLHKSPMCRQLLMAASPGRLPQMSAGLSCGTVTRCAM